MLEKSSETKLSLLAFICDMTTFEENVLRSYHVSTCCLLKNSWMGCAETGVRTMPLEWLKSTVPRHPSDIVQMLVAAQPSQELVGK